MGTEFIFAKNFHAAKKLVHPWFAPIETINDIEMTDA
jgi:hypothetical protein